MKPLRIIAIALILFFTLTAEECTDRPTATQIEKAQQEQSTMRAVQSVGMPAITEYQEKRTLKNILELRDKAVATVTYTQDLNAKLHKLCDSIGFGIPYATQYTNPERIARSQELPYGQSNLTLPQADPNGLYSPPAAEGTWVMCLNPKTKEMAATYVEPRIIVSTFPLTE